MGKLDGKVALITGGSSGIGLATARLFAREGADVVIAGRRQAELDAAVEAIGDAAIAVRADVSDLDDLDRIYATIDDVHGALDVVVANAGYVELFTLADATPEHFDRTFGVNARGTFFTVQKALPLLRRGGAVVLVSSSANAVGFPAYTAYSASKAAMRSFGRSWAAELKERGVRVNVLSPGPIDTPIIDLQFATKEQADATREQFAGIIPMGRLGRAEEVAAAALFLACDDSSFSTGIDLVVDGGQTQL
ncbi:MAG: SDR family NAD(P)-dependent oxidoreductase [Thermoleophilia bacterium]